MSERFDWPKAHELYLLVFKRLHSDQENPADKSISEAVTFLRTIYAWHTYCAGRKSNVDGALDDQVSAAWTRFVMHCLSAKEPYRSFHSLVIYQTKAALFDSFREAGAQKRNCGKQPLSYDESQEGEPVSGVISAVEAHAPDIGPADVSEALEALCADGSISGLQRQLFWDYIYEGLPTRELMVRYDIARASFYRCITHIGRLLRRYL